MAQITVISGFRARERQLHHSGSRLNFNVDPSERSL